MTLAPSMGRWRLTLAAANRPLIHRPPLLRGTPPDLGRRTIVARIAPMAREASGMGLSGLHGPAPRGDQFRGQPVAGHVLTLPIAGPPHGSSGWMDAADEVAVAVSFGGHSHRFPRRPRPSPGQDTRVRPDGSSACGMVHPSQGERGISLFWPTDAQMARPGRLSARSHGKPRGAGRQVSGGMIFIDRNGLRCCGAPREYGPSKAPDDRWNRWSDRGVFARMVGGPAAEAGVPKSVMIDATSLKAHRRAAGLHSKEGEPTINTGA